MAEQGGCRLKQKAKQKLLENSNFTLQSKIFNYEKQATHTQSICKSIQMANYCRRQTDRNSPNQQWVNTKVRNVTDRTSPYQQWVNTKVRSVTSKYKISMRARSTNRQTDKISPGRWWISMRAIIGGSCHKYHFCRNKSFVATNTCLSRQYTSFVMTKYVCRDKHKTRLLLQQKSACYDKMFVATKIILL